MTPEEIAEIRQDSKTICPTNIAAVSWQAHARELLEHIDEQAAEIKRLRGDICYPGQCEQMIGAEEKICEQRREIDQQAEEIKRLEAENYQWRSYNHELGNKSHKQRLALKKLGERVRAKHRAWREEQHWHDIDLGRVKRLEDALVEERAASMSTNGYANDELRIEAREQLRAEGVIG